MPTGAGENGGSKRAQRPARKLPKTLSSAELDALMATPNLGCPSGLRDRCVMELMWRCGLRVSEVCGLHLRDIDWQAREIRLRPEIAKGNKEAVVYFDDRTLGWLERWKIVRRPLAAGGPWLFVCVRAAELGQPLNRHGVYRMMRRRTAKAGIERRVGPHALRHTFATELLGENFNLPEVQELMRHSDIRTTRVYLHVRDEQLREKVRRRAGA